METPTFALAADSYVNHSGEARYLPRLVGRFGPDPVASITPMAVRQAAQHLYPDASPATWNRQVVTPARAVLYHAHELGWRMPARVRLFSAPTTRKVTPASRRWLETFVDRCDADRLPHVAACVLFMNLTGARVSEAVNLLGQNVDLRRRTALLVKTKTDFNSLRYLPDHLVERIRDLAPGPGDRVFRYSSRYSVNERIAAVCDRAGLPRKASHAVGRHASATNALNAGVGVRVAMDAGGWKSPTIFLGTYAHTIDAGRTVMDRFNAIHHADQF
ncbi:tyrosine-type recombinase/integrase [Brevundimonas subvibrioides]|uniref:Integrase family protein n=1 Tax=Brevundimonas subvibrioides (strain ATCC 15264 / DSM 4735 / LMG 14903 / NBRC 16000 / CB 81) TaxID=633149 RepID=D9QFZ9_BRESC|nr:tyrosine-type recombinase/integrase [Brevundimonas subvibrioides]ADL00713.1 integrase family protein [Brevundimonas subvibrioides ATCC 15264]